MQQVTEGGNFDLERLMEAGKGEEASDDDNETKFLRSRVQGQDHIIPHVFLTV